MFTNYHLDKILNLFRGTTYTAPASVYAAQLTSVTDPKAGTVMEASYAGYGRVAVSFSAPAGVAAYEYIANTADIVFPAKTDVGDAIIVALGLYDAQTLGNLLDVTYLGGSNPNANRFDVGVADATNGVTLDLIIAENHGFIDGDRVTVGPYPGMATLPGGLTAWADYYITQSASHSFKLSTSPTGTPVVDITSPGSLMIFKVVPVTLTQGDSLRVTANSWTIYIR